LARWPRTQHLSLKITYRGGAESWWLVETRGRTGVFPGHAQLEDVMSAVMNEPDYVADGRGDRERSQDRITKATKRLD
jgi:hypothetical protein